MAKFYPGEEEKFLAAEKLRKEAEKAAKEDKKHFHSDHKK